MNLLGLFVLKILIFCRSCALAACLSLRCVIACLCCWTLSTVTGLFLQPKVLLLSHLPASPEKCFPDSWNGVCSNGTPPNLFITVAPQDFCLLFVQSFCWSALVKTRCHTAETGIFETHVQTDTALSPAGAVVFWLQPLFRKLSIHCLCEYNSSVNENGLCFAPSL